MRNGPTTSRPGRRPLVRDTPTVTGGRRHPVQHRLGGPDGPGTTEVTGVVPPGGTGPRPRDLCLLPYPMTSVEVEGRVGSLCGLMYSPVRDTGSLCCGRPFPFRRCRTHDPPQLGKLGGTVVDSIKQGLLGPDPPRKRVTSTSTTLLWKRFFEGN